MLGAGPVKAALGLEDVSEPAIGFAAIGLSLFGFVLSSLSEKPRAAAPMVSSGGWRRRRRPQRVWRRVRYSVP